jgi:hypothetical protein
MAVYNTTHTHTCPPARCRETAGILATLPRAALPPLERRWLLAAAWNDGVLSARMGRAAHATGCMQVRADKVLLLLLLCVFLCLCIRADEK